MDAYAKGINTGDKVDYFTDMDEQAIYIGKIPEVTVKNYNGYVYKLSPNQIWFCDEDEESQILECHGGCVNVLGHCQPTNFSLDLQPGDIFKDFGYVVAVNLRDAVYTEDGVYYTMPGEYGKYRTIRKHQQEPEYEYMHFTPCQDGYAHVTRLYNKI